MNEQIMQRLREANTSRDNITAGDFTFSTGSPGQPTTVAEYQPKRAVSVDGSRPFDLSLVAYETFTTDGTDGNTETFSLSHELIDSNVVTDSLVLYEGDKRVQPDSVDYAGDSFDYTAGGADNTLTAYYTSGAQALVELQKVAPNGTPDVLFSADMGMIHRRDQGKEPITVDADQSPLHPFVPADFTLALTITAPYTVAFATDANGSGTEVVATNALTDLPVRGAEGPIDGLKQAVATDAARR
ncbi:hypothetical protein IL252_13675 [Halomicrobium sp. IBSBa]|uniref:hypothetical protein n=1 Tax=Halomicrobium sp. IBSBa TaxID=2778916 RepID=UPI001ABF26C1|nr:hypothetical protein [Halomicrobium sp. IBSBa]MBO4248869.1 hypothetical protein [Halomicrobium sp. IBSBa]